MQEKAKARLRELVPAARRSQEVGFLACLFIQYSILAKCAIRGKLMKHWLPVLQTLQYTQSVQSPCSLTISGVRYLPSLLVSLSSVDNLDCALTRKIISFTVSEYNKN